MSLPIADRVRGIAADVLEVPAATIRSDSSPKNVALWDSVRQLNLVLALEQEFGVQFEPQEIATMTDIENIVSILRRKLNDHCA